VLDHVGSPDVKGGGGVAAWAAALQTIATGAPNVVVKLGGVLQYFKNASGVLPGADETAPYVLGALDAFGFQRSLYEGNCALVNQRGASGLLDARALTLPFPFYSPQGSFVIGLVGWTWPMRGPRCSILRSSSAAQLRRSWTRCTRATRRARTGLSRRKTVVYCRSKGVLVNFKTQGWQ
jgi:hypothetical protein